VRAVEAPRYRYEISDLVPSAPGRAGNATDLCTDFLPAPVLPQSVVALYSTSVEAGNPGQYPGASLHYKAHRKIHRQPVDTSVSKSITSVITAVF
jgi:hypothetical protein